MPEYWFKPFFSCSEFDPSDRRLPAAMSGQQPPGNNSGIAASRPTTNGNSNAGMSSMVSQQRSNDSPAVGPPTANVAQNGSMSQANLNNIVSPIISLWTLLNGKPYASYVVLVQNSICFDFYASLNFRWVFFYFLLSAFRLYTRCGCHIMNKQGSWFPDSMTLIENYGYDNCSVIWFCCTQPLLADDAMILENYSCIRDSFSLPSFQVTFFWWW